MHVVPTRKMERAVDISGPAWFFDQHWPSRYRPWHFPADCGHSIANSVADVGRNNRARRVVSLAGIIDLAALLFRSDRTLCHDVSPRLGTNDKDTSELGRSPRARRNARLHPGTVDRSTHCDHGRYRPVFQARQSTSVTRGVAAFIWILALGVDILIACSH